MGPEPLPSLPAHVTAYLESLAIRHYSTHTISNRRITLGYFLAWAKERSVEHPADLTRTVLESYQRWLSQYAKSTGEPLSTGSQVNRMGAVFQFCRWLVRQGLLPHNPAADLEPIRRSRPLPRMGFTVPEVERIFAIPDLKDPIGLRDRAMMEVLYASAIRRLEMAKLKQRDIDTSRAAITVREGKGRKGRTVPLGVRALGWVQRYCAEARPRLVVSPDEGFVFLSQQGNPMDVDRLSILVREYIERAKLGEGRPGACHLFRHSAATHMLERGADLKVVQEMLGHELLSTTGIYLKVAVPRLLAVHAATHPSSPGAPREATLPLGNNSLGIENENVAE